MMPKPTLPPPVAVRSPLDLRVSGPVPVMTALIVVVLVLARADVSIMPPAVPMVTPRLPANAWLATVTFSVPPSSVSWSAVKLPGAAPRLASPATASVPAVTDVLPVKVLLPVSASVPAPALVRPKLPPPSPMAPPTVRVLPIVSRRLPPSVTAPVPRFRL